MSYTHRKRAYHATCVQYDGWNTEQLLDLLNDEKIQAVPYGTEGIMIRFSEPEAGQKVIDTISVGWWVVIGENGAKKCYDDQTFKIKYEEVN